MTVIPGWENLPNTITPELLRRVNEKRHAQTVALTAITCCTASKWTLKGDLTEISCRTLVRAYLDTGLCLPRGAWEWGHYGNRRALSDPDLKRRLLEEVAAFRRPRGLPAVGRRGRPPIAASAGSTARGARKGIPKTWTPETWITLAADLVRCWVQHLNPKSLDYPYRRHTRGAARLLSDPLPPDHVLRTLDQLGVKIGPHGEIISPIRELQPLATAMNDHDRATAMNDHDRAWEEIKGRSKIERARAVARFLECVTEGHLSAASILRAIRRPPRDRRA